MVDIEELKPHEEVIEASLNYPKKSVEMASFVTHSLSIKMIKSSLMGCTDSILLND